MNKKMVLGAISILMLFGLTQAQRLIGDDDVWPGTIISDGNYKAYIPDDVEEFEFMIWRHQCGLEAQHNESVFCLSAKCIYVFLLEGYSESKAPTMNFLQKVADETGHPEIPRLPIMSDGECNPMKLKWLVSDFPDQISVFYTWHGEGDSEYYDDAIVLHQAEEGRDKLDNMGFKPAGDGMYIKLPNWGWPHGYYGAENTAYFLYQTVAAMRKPEGGYTSAGAKPKPLSDIFPNEWRGDPESWNGLHPKIYPRSEYPGNANNGVWLPTKEFAHLWRSRVSRDPDLTMRQIGMDNEGSNGNNFGNSAYPFYWIKSPSLPYHPKKNLAKSYPLYQLGSIVSISIKNGYSSPTVDSVYFYERDKMIAAQKGHPLNFNGMTHALNNTGVTFLYAEVKFSDGSRLISRPSTVFVSSVKGSVSLDPVKQNLEQNKGRTGFDKGKWNLLHNQNQYDLKGSKISNSSRLMLEFD